MYAKFFGLRELPFNNTPDPRFFYSTPDHEEALASLIYAVQERKGFVLLTGEVGAGKTLVSRMMLRHFDTRISFANLHHAVQGAADLMESLCAEFELPVRQGAGRTGFVHVLHDFLLEQFAKDRPVVLVLDEAQTLPAEAFEQLRMIGNLEADDAKLLQIVILGQPELQRRFAHHQFHQLRQRIFRTFHLPALSLDTAEGYIRHRLAVAGAPNLDIFDGTAVSTIHKHSQGFPRLINTICDNAMLSAYSADRRRIDGQFVESIVDQMMSLTGAEVETSADARPLPEHQAQPAHLTPTRPAVVGTGVPGCPPPGTEPAELVEVLARRVADLESRLRGTRVAASVAAMSNASEDRPALMQDLKDEAGRIEQQLVSKIDEARRYLADLGDRAADTMALLDDARAVRDARTVVAHIDGGCRKVSQQETHVHGTAVKMKATLEDVRRVLDGLKRTSAEALRAKRSAQAVHDRLVAQTGRSRELADELARSMDRTIAASRGQHNHATLLKEGLAPVDCASGNSRATAAPAQERLQEMLERSRESLADLRTLVCSPIEPSATDTTAQESHSTDPPDPPETGPTARLALQVESLLDVGETGLGTGFGGRRSSS